MCSVRQVVASNYFIISLTRYFKNIIDSVWNNEFAIFREMNDILRYQNTPDSNRVFQP